MASSLLLTNARPAVADEASTQAAGHFAHGVQLVKQGDLESAASAFETAHSLRPHPAVLYNLGQTYASLGRPVDAVMTLKRYLAEATDIPPPRRQEVTELIAFHEKRIGTLAVSVAPADAELLVDGKLVASQGSSSSIEVAAGSRTLLVRREGYQPATLIQLVRPRETSEARIALEPLKGSKTGWLEISCRVPDVATYIDGTLVGHTPWQRPLQVSPGRHVLTFSRAGYEAAPTTVDVRDRTTAGCELSPSSRLVRTFGGRLHVLGAPAKARILVDGEPYRGQLLPVGKHLLLVESPGYQSWTGAYSLAGGQTTVVDVALAPTPAERKRLGDDARSTRRTYAYVGGGVGAALCGVAGVLYAVNRQRYEDYAADSDALSRELSRGPASADQLDRLGKLTDRAAAIERLDYMAVTTGLVGVAVLGTAVGLYLSAAESVQSRETGGLVGIRGVVW